MRRYEASMYNSNRWDGFELRPGDIIISAPPKCGTTWTQMICALLILQEPELPLPLDTLSPWIDMVTRARTEVFADLEAQTHRRFIKTHTPLDGIPSDPTVTYICVGRDPRDVGLSMDHHIDNTDIGAFLGQRDRAAAIDGIDLGLLPPPRPRPDGERDRFWQWVDDEAPSTQVGSSLRRTVEHLQTFLHAVPAGGSDITLDLLALSAGAAMGAIGGLATRLRPGADGRPLGRAGALAAGMWIAGVGARMVFYFAVTHGAGPAIAAFSIAHHITGPAAWAAALVMMALADVLTRLAVVWMRGHRLTATVTPPAPASAPAVAGA